MASVAPGWEFLSGCAWRHLSYLQKPVHTKTRRVDNTNFNFDSFSRCFRPKLSWKISILSTKFVTILTCATRALYFSGYFIMTWVSLSKWNGLVNGLRHFLWLCTSDSYQDLGKQQQDIWIWYIFLCLWGPVVLFQISAVQRGGREREIVRKREVEGGGEVGLIVSHL